MLGSRIKIALNLLVKARCGCLGMEAMPDVTATQWIASSKVCVSGRTYFGDLKDRSAQKYGPIHGTRHPEDFTPNPTIFKLGIAIVLQRYLKGCELPSTERLDRGQSVESRMMSWKRDQGPGEIEASLRSLLSNSIGGLAHKGRCIFEAKPPPASSSLLTRLI